MLNLSGDFGILRNRIVCLEAEEYVKKLALFVLVLYLLVLVLCSCTLFWQGPVPALMEKLTKTVSFEEKVLKTTSSSITVKLQPGETELLARFPNLKAADFRGSEALEEIIAWSRANPQVSVVYSVPLPDGAMVDSTVAELDLSGISTTNFAQYEAVLEYLPKLQRVNLGSAASAADGLSTEQIKHLIDNFPAVTFDYRMELLGRHVSLYDESIDLSGLTADMAEQARQTLLLMKNLKSVNLGDQNSTPLSWADIKNLVDARPEASFTYSFQLYGKPFDLSSEVIDLSHTPVSDEGQAVREALRCMKNCKTLDMDSCGVSDDRMAEIRQEFPDVDVIWRIWFGQLYSVRTDVERILASKPTVGGMLDDNETAKLRHCTKVKYLDLGHNDYMTNINFVSSMPDLEVLIIAMNHIYDLSPLANCPKLEYMEVSTTAISDLSPLANAKALRHLNISCCPLLYDISPLYALTELERLWISNQTPIPIEQVQQMQAAAPNCKISTISDDPHGDSWRYTNYDVNYHIWTWTPRYELLREQLGYDYQEYSFYWLDPKSGLSAPPEYASTYYIHESQLTGQ